MDFAPDLVIEATSVCDRQCPGCYAPNLVSKASPDQLYRERPGLFLNPTLLGQTLLKIGTTTTIAIRGGEPSRHPEIVEILDICHRSAEQVYLETHGRWIGDVSLELNRETNHANRIAAACAQFGTILKLSFDRMHGLSAHELKDLTIRLDSRSISWVVAITEPSIEAFAETRASCQWIPDSQIIFQKKAVSAADLYRPTIGVIRTDGTLSTELSTLSRFKQLREAVL